MSPQLESSTFLPFIRRYWLQYGVSVACAIGSIAPKFSLILLTSYAVKRLQTPPAFLPWEEIAGTHLGPFLSSVLSGTEFGQGISLEAQTALFLPCLVAAALLVAFLKVLGDTLTEDLGEKIARDVRVQVLRAYTGLSYLDAREVPPSLLSAMGGEDPREIKAAFTRLHGSVWADILTLVVLFAWLIALDIQLFCLFCAVLVPAVVILRRTRKRLGKITRQGLAVETTVLGSVLEKLRARETIASFQAVEFEMGKFTRTSNTLFHLWRRATRAKAMGVPAVEWLGLLAACLVLMAALRRVADNSLTSGVLTGFLVTTAHLSAVGQSVFTQMQGSRKGQEALRRIRRFLRRPASPVIPQAAAAAHVPQTLVVKGLVLFRDSLLPPVDLCMTRGDFVVVRGASGLGKSTFLHAVLGLHPPVAGQILWDDKPPGPGVFGTDPWKLLAFLPQEPFLISGSVGNNTAFPGATPQGDVEAALRRAGLPLGPETSASRLSVGERQRLAAARGFYQGAKVWIVDEGTSALDEAAETAFLVALKEFTQDGMVLLVTHRSAPSAFATKILDLEEPPGAPA